MRGFFCFSTQPLKENCILYKTNPMRKFLLILSLSALVACSDDDLQSCNISDKAWFDQFKNELDDNCSIETSIFEGSYEGQVVYYTLVTDPKVNFQAMLDLYDCDGNFIADLSAEESNSYLDSRRGSDKLIFTCSE